MYIRSLTHTDTLITRTQHTATYFRKLAILAKVRKKTNDRGSNLTEMLDIGIPIEKMYIPESLELFR